MWAPHRGAVACAAESRYACHMQLECTVLDEVQPVGCGDARSEYTVAGTGLQSPGLMGDVVGTDAAAQRTGPGTRAGAGVEVDRHVCFVHRGCLGRVINGPAGAYIGCMVGSAPRAGVEEERPVVCIGSASGTSRTAAQLGFPTRGAEASARFVCDTVRGMPDDWSRSRIIGVVSWRIGPNMGTCACVVWALLFEGRLGPPVVGECRHLHRPPRPDRHE